MFAQRRNSLLLGLFAASAIGLCAFTSPLRAATNLPSSIQKPAAVTLDDDKDKDKDKDRDDVKDDKHKEPKTKDKPDKDKDKDKDDKGGKDKDKD